MIHNLLRKHLEPVARDQRRWRLNRGLAWCWVGAAVATMAFLLLRYVTGWSSPLVLPCLLAFTVIAALAIWRRNREDRFDYQAMASQIESEDPKLHALLLTAVEQQPDAVTGELNYLQQRVISEALAWKRRHLWEQYSGQRLFFAQCGQWSALLLLAVLLTHLRSTGPAGRAMTGVRSNGVAVTPGDASVERGSSLVVLARFEGRLPAEASLVIQPVTGEQRRLALVKNLDDPVFGGSIPGVKDALSYRVEFSGGRTREFKVTVFEFPELQHADAHLKFPEYTGLPEKTIADTRRISAVEGSALDYSFHLNKPVVSATLIARDKPALPLTPDPVRSNIYHAAFALDQSRQYELRLVDDAGRTNKLPPQFVIDVLKNRPPELKLAAPGDQRVSPIEEIRFKAEAADDFGLRAYGIAYSLAGGETRFVELGRDSQLNEKRLFDHLLPLEDLAVAPDQLVSYFVWADDIGPDGMARRTSSDMFFAEVRPFDEIFRESQQPEGGGGGGGGGEQGGESAKLSELQKQIVTATWNLQRRETGSRPSAQFKPDATVIHESQKEALSQAQELREKTGDPRLQGLVDAAVQEMEKAVSRLDEAAGKNSIPALPPALSAEQAAYQALLRLQAREYQVSRGRNQGGGGGGGQRSQRQIDQLDLKTSENRYETQRQATPQQQSAQREQLQVLSRLKELAQRQQDLNERVKELQTALQEAKTEEEREEVRRRLKRLREEEQELMAGIDELNQRMSKPENQSRMAEAQKQLEQTRSEVQRAAEALDDGAVSQALASGARAQRNLQQMSDDLRKKSSSQFSEDMRRMREEARQLAQKQEELQRQLNTPGEAQQKTLRDSAADDRQKLASEFNDQAKRIDQLLEHAGQVTQQAENVEPLLSRQLYDTLRKASQDDAKNLQETTEELLRSGQLVRPVYERLQSGKSEAKRSVAVTSELLRDGFPGEAGQLADRAGRSIKELKQDVEKAAASVLGDDTEALRLAGRELEDLARQLEQEMAAANSTNRTGSSGETASNQTTGQPSGQRSPNGQAGQPGEEANPAGSPGSSPTSAANSPSAEPRPSPGTPGEQPLENATASAGQPGGSPQPGSQPGQGQPGQGQPGRGQQGQANSSGTQPGGQNNSPGQRNPEGAGGGDRFFDRMAGGGADGGGGGGGGGPITGTDYAQWSDRLRDVEEMLDAPDLKTEVSRIRDRARAYRQEYRKAGEKPSWAQVKLEISGPLVEVRSRIAEELARRQSSETPVPADRDPVPAKFAELVRRYYEQLGKSE